MTENQKIRTTINEHRGMFPIAVIYDGTRYDKRATVGTPEYVGTNGQHIPGVTMILHIADRKAEIADEAKVTA